MIKQFIIAAILLVSCTQQEKKSFISTMKEVQYNYFGAVRTFDYEVSGMKYKVFTGGTSQSGVFVVNITKDSLEVALKRQELNKN